MNHPQEVNFARLRSFAVEGYSAVPFRERAMIDGQFSNGGFKEGVLAKEKRHAANR